VQTPERRSSSGRPLPAWVLPVSPVATAVAFMLGVCPAGYSNVGADVTIANDAELRDDHTVSCGGGFCLYLSAEQIPLE